MLAKPDRLHFLSPERFCTNPNRKKLRCFRTLAVIKFNYFYTSFHNSLYIYLYAEFQNLTLRFLSVQGLTLTRYFLQSLSSLAL